MKRQCILVFDHWFVSDGHGSFTSPGNYQPELLADRYLNSFDDLFILGRCRDIKPGQVVHSGPFSNGSIRLGVVAGRGGPWGALRGVLRLRRWLVENEQQATFILVLPGLLGSIASVLLRRASYGVEMVGDAGESLAVLGKNSLLSRLWGRFTARATRRAAGVAYVSAHLSRSYPPGPDAFTTSYSSIQLPAAALRTAHVIQPRVAGRVRLVTVARLEQPYKGIDVLLRALSQLDDGFELDVVGGGRLLDDYRRLAEDLGVDGRVRFHGPLPQGEAVRAVLDTADMYVQPSLTEGLPRAVVEAMARGLPCVATRVGGIPELLGDPWLVSPGSHSELAHVVAGACADQEKLRRAKLDNLERAKDFLATELQPRRDRFYDRLAANSSMTQ